MPTIQSEETIIVQLPTRREHKWTGLTEVIGRYVMVKMTDSDGRVGWGEAPALKDWGGEFGRYFGESALITRAVLSQLPCVFPEMRGHQNAHKNEIQRVKVTNSELTSINLVGLLQESKLKYPSRRAEYRCAHRDCGQVFNSFECGKHARVRNGNSR